MPAAPVQPASDSQGGYAAVGVVEDLDVVPKTKRGRGWVSGSGSVTPKGRLDYTYTPQGQLLTQKQKIGSSSIAFDLGYAYDKLGRLTGISHPGAVSINQKRGQSKYLFE